MKNRFKIVSLIFVILCVVALMACSAPKEESGGGDNVVPDTPGDSDITVEIEKQYNDNIKYKLSYTGEEECPNGNITDNNLHAKIDFEIGKTYYMVVDFTVESFESDGWDNNFSSQINVLPATAVSATLEEAATGNFTEKTENKVTSITTSYGIPEIRDEEKSYRVILQFKPIDIDMIDFTFSFYGDGEDEQTVATDRISFNMGVTEGLLYALTEDEQSYSVVSGDHESSSVIIPTFYRGLPVTRIGGGAFYNYSNLTSIVIHGCVTNIGDNAFYGCKSLTSVTLPSSVTSIGNGAFYYCSDLTGVYITDVAAWCNIAFGSYYSNPLYYAKNLYLNNELLTDLVLPDSVTRIGDLVFCHGNCLTSITLPSSVTSIGECAFQYCHNLTSITLPSSLTSIGASAFSSCISLTSITLPGSVTNIGGRAFEYCNKLTIYCEAEKKPGGWDGYWNYSNRPVVWGETI